MAGKETEEMVSEEALGVLEGVHFSSSPERELLPYCGVPWTHFPAIPYLLLTFYLLESTGDMLRLQRMRCCQIRLF